LISVRKKLNIFTIYGWAGMYWKIQNKPSLPTKSSNDFLTGFQYKNGEVVTLEFKARRKIIIELFNDSGIYSLQKNINYY